MWLAFRMSGILSEKNKMYLCLLKSIAYKEVNNRPGRYEPIKNKRRQKYFELLEKPRKSYQQEVA
jgi:hypothetical protein